VISSSSIVTAPAYRGRVLIRRCETGLSLQPAPEFGPDGAWPPVVTEWLPLSWALFWTDSGLDPLEDPPGLDPAAVAAAAILKQFTLYRRDEDTVEDALRTEDALRDDFLHESAFAWFPEGTELCMPVSRGGQVSTRDFTLWMEEDADTFHPCYHVGELRRAVHSVRWRRKDPVTQLPPGVTHEVTQSVITGLSVEHTRTLADSLGLDLGAEVAGAQARLSSQVRQEFGLKLDITTQQEHSTKVTLSNPGDIGYRLFAVWYMDHRISVDALALPVHAAGRSLVFRSHSYGFRPAWQQRERLEFAAEDEPHMTYVVVGR
jgi:hypothetical protein